MSTTLKTLIDGHVESVFLNMDHFGEIVLFTDHSGTPTSKPFKCLVEIDEPIRHDGGQFPTLYTGTLRFPATKRPQILSEASPSLTATIRGSVYDLTDMGADDFGFCNVGIRRELPAHSNAVSLDGTQHRYG